MWLAVSVHHTLLHSIFFFFFFFVLHNDAGRSLATGHVLTQFLALESVQQGFIYFNRLATSFARAGLASSIVLATRACTSVSASFNTFTALVCLVFTV